MLQAVITASDKQPQQGVEDVQGLNTAVDGEIQLFNTGNGGSTALTLINYSRIIIATTIVIIVIRLFSAT